MPTKNETRKASQQETKAEQEKVNAEQQEDVQQKTDTKQQEDIEEQKRLEREHNVKTKKNPYSKDGSWKELNGLNPEDPGYGIMLEELEWQRRRQRRYSLVLAFEIFFAVLIFGIIIYFIVTS